MATTQPLPALVADAAGARPIGLPGRLRFRLRLLLRALAERDRIARERRRLAELDDRQLRDIGLTRHQAVLESRRRFWG